MEVLHSKAASSTPAYRSFVRHAATVLAKTSPRRVIVVDDFEALDRVSRDVMRVYLRSILHREAEHATGPELWVVFERPDGDRLSDEIALAVGDRLSTDEYLSQQDLLTEEAAADLSQRVGAQPPKRRLPVKDICRPRPPSPTFARGGVRLGGARGARAEVCMFLVDTSCAVAT